MFVPSVGAVVADRYVLVREIGRGGMGSIWQGFDQQLAAPCALKFILQAFAHHPELRTRFLREARAVASLQSPHLVAIRSVGEHDETLYIAMELLDGETLQQRLDRDLHLSPEQTLTVVDQVASVLTKAHAAGIVHRDLKPENIWLWADGALFIKVLDFGVAKHLAESADTLKTATGALVGTPHYMSPEQAEAKAVDFRTDLWALGIIAIECLTGNRPFEGNSVAALLIKVARDPIPTMHEIAPAFSGLQAWWERASSRAPEGRFQSARQLAEQLRAALNARASVAPVARTSFVEAGTRPMPEVASPIAQAVRPLPPTEPYQRISLPPTGSPVMTTRAPPLRTESTAPWILGAIAGLLLLSVGGAAGYWFLGRSEPVSALAEDSPLGAASELPPAPLQVTPSAAVPAPPAASVAVLPVPQAAPSSVVPATPKPPKSPAAAPAPLPRYPETRPAAAAPKPAAPSAPKPPPQAARPSVDQRLGF